MSFAALQNTLLGKSPTLHREAVDLVFKFAGVTLEDEELDKIVSEAKSDPIEPVMYPGMQPNADIKPDKKKPDTKEPTPGAPGDQP
jgi:hypothetical protein